MVAKVGLRITRQLQLKFIRLLRIINFRIWCTELSRITARLPSRTEQTVLELMKAIGGL